MTHQVCIHTNDKKYSVTKEEKIIRKFVTAPERFKRNLEALNNKVWDPDFGKVTWKLETDSPTIDGRKAEVKLFKRVFLQPSILTDLVINQKRRSTADIADIVINFNHTDPLFKRRPNVLAYAYGPADGIGGDSVFNTNHVWTLDGLPIDADEYARITGKDVEDFDNTFRTYDLQHTALHEVGGHSLGLPHIPECRNCVMYPYYNGQRKFQGGDLNLLYGFYEEASLPTKLLNYLYQKILG